MRLLAKYDFEANEDEKEYVDEHYKIWKHLKSVLNIEVHVMKIFVIICI
jgi:hypothetical protein